MVEPETKAMVRLALVTSLAIALATFTAAAWTGSCVMLAAAIQALAAMSSQSLMLIGIGRASRPATATAADTTPAGMQGPRNGDIYFWCFAAGALLFSMAAGVAIYDGAHRLVKPQRIAETEMAYWVAALAAAAQSYVLFRAVQIAPKPVDGQGLAAALRAARAAPLLTVVTEAIASLAGLALVFIGIALVHLAGQTWADGATGLMIGLLLATVATFMSMEVRALLSNANTAVAANAPTPVAVVAVDAADPESAHATEPQTTLPVAESVASLAAPADSASPNAASPHSEHALGKHRGKKKGRHRYR